MLLKKIVYLLPFIGCISSDLFCKGKVGTGGSFLKGERLSNFGNFNILKYRKFNNDKLENEGENNPELSEFYKIYDAVKSIKYLNLCLQNMVLIHGQKDFKFGFSCDGDLAGKIIEIDPFFLSSTKITRDQYYKFLEIVNKFLKNRNNSMKLYMPEKKVIDKFLGGKKRKKRKSKKNKNNGQVKKKISKEEEKANEELRDKRFMEYLQDYFALRNEMFEVLREQGEDYLHFLIPRFEEYKNFPFKDDDFMNEYMFNESYGDYPIILVNYYQYVEYCKWQTLCVNEYLFEHLDGKERVMVIFYPVSYEEYFYASCCGDSNNIYSCGVSPLNSNYEPLFNFNSVSSTDNKIRITKVKKFPKSQFNIYDSNGNTRVWFGSRESDYSKLSNKKREPLLNRTNGVFKKLLDEGYNFRSDNYNEDVDKSFRMTSKGSCNSRLRDAQNGRFINEHVFYVSPFLGFTLAAKIILDE